MMIMINLLFRTNSINVHDLTLQYNGELVFVF